jgi:heme exporter protein D
MMGHFESFSEFIQMGKHGYYVWLSYGIGLLVIVYNILSVYLEERLYFKDAKRRLKRQEREQSEKKSV